MSVDIAGARPTRPANRILRGLPPSEFARLAPHLERVVLPQNAMLQPVDEKIEHVFPPALEASACACYRTIRDEVDRLLSTTEQYDITSTR